MASAAERTIRVGPLAWPIDVSVLEAWLITAEPGDAIVYSHGQVPARGVAVWERARELSDEGEVRLHQRRHATNPKWTEWYAVRRVPDVAAPAAVAVIPADEPESEEAALLRAIRRWARFGLPCPDNRRIDAEMRWPAGRAAYRFRCLRDAGLIEVEQQGPGKPRVVRVVGTRLVTAAAAAGAGR